MNILNNLSWVQIEAIKKLFKEDGDIKPNEMVHVGVDFASGQDSTCYVWLDEVSQFSDEQLKYIIESRKIPLRERKNTIAINENIAKAIAVNEIFKPPETRAERRAQERKNKKS